MARPQTIQIYLPGGDPRGMRVAEITTRIVRVIEVPRSQLADFLKMPEAQQVGVYFLMGELSEAGLPRAYIGQSGRVVPRAAHPAGHTRGHGAAQRAGHRSIGWHRIAGRSRHVAHGAVGLRHHGRHWAGDLAQALKVATARQLK